MHPDFVLKVESVMVGNKDLLSTACEKIDISLEGVRKDRHFGFSKTAGVREKRFHEKGTEIWNSRQWSAVSVEELAEIAEGMGIPEVKPEWLGANILFSGHAAFTQLPPLTRFVFENGVVLLEYAENLPCVFPARAMRQEDPTITEAQERLFSKSALHKRGLVGWVERAGVIRQGELVKVYLPVAA